MRLDQPFDELKYFCNAIDLDKLSESDHSHMPYLVILYKYLEQWRKLVKFENLSLDFLRRIKKTDLIIIRMMEKFQKLLKKKSLFEN